MLRCDFLQVQLQYYILIIAVVIGEYIVLKAIRRSDITFRIFVWIYFLSLDTFNLWSLLACTFRILSKLDEIIFCLIKI